MVGGSYVTWRFPLDKINKEKGIIKTGWVEGFSQRKARSIMTDRSLMITGKKDIE